MKLRSILSLIFGLLLSAPLFAQNSLLSTIDPPGSVDTRAFGINPKGQIVGLYVTADYVTHGFLLSQGKYITIDAPDSIRTNALSINPQGQIVGRYDTPDGLAHGYIYTDGSFQTIDHPLAVGFTVVTDITPTGAVVGRYRGTDKSFHGFSLANPQQCLLGIETCDWTTIDHLDANGNPDMGLLGIQGMAISPDNVVAGYYQDTSKVFHAFTLDNGIYTALDPPNAKSTGGGGGVLHINPEGTVVGYYTGLDNAAHGFIYRGGIFTIFDFPDPAAANGKANGTCNLGLNPQGDIVGLYVDHANREHGFLASRGTEQEN